MNYSNLLRVHYLVSSSDGQPRIHIGIGMIEIPATRYIWITPKNRCNFRQLVTGKNTGTKLFRFTRFSRQMTSEKFKKMGVLIQICFMKLEFDNGYMERYRS